MQTDSNTLSPSTPKSEYLIVTPRGKNMSNGFELKGYIKGYLKQSIWSTQEKIPPPRKSK